MIKDNNQKFVLKEKIINSLMSDGQKEICEKILFKTLKSIQRTNLKNYTNILQLFIVNLTPVFKFNTQSRKRGKKKKITNIPCFLPNNELRISFALKLLKSILSKQKKSTILKSLPQEILISIISDKGVSVEKKNELQKQILTQKRYFYKFKWFKI